MIVILILFITSISFSTSYSQIRKLDLKALDVFPFQKKGMDYIKQGQYDKAEEEFKKALKIDLSKSYVWTWSESHYGLGLAYAYQHKFNEAEVELKIAIELQPEYSDVYYSLASIYALQKKYSLSIEYLEKALQKGYKDFEFIKNDIDLTNIKDDAKFKKMMVGR